MNYNLKGGNPEFDNFKEKVNQKIHGLTKDWWDRVDVHLHGGIYQGQVEYGIIDVDGEEMKVTKITGNKLNVERGQDSTIAKAHVRGTGVKGIDYSGREDSNIIELGDDFGFDGSYS